MKKLLIAAAATALLSAGAVSGASAQTVNCPAGGNNNQGPVQGSTGAGQNTAAANPTCETLVMPNGKQMLQNGPATNDPGSNTAPHESGNGGSGNGAAGGTKG
jgi:hypothetical protein